MVDVFREEKIVLLSMTDGKNDNGERVPGHIKREGANKEHMGKASFRYFCLFLSFFCFLPFYFFMGARNRPGGNSL